MMGTTRLICIRHGQGEDNIGGFLVNSLTSNGLTTLGREQAAAVAEEIRLEGVAAMYASPIPRAAETAALIGQALRLPVSTVHDLREMDLGEWEGLPSQAADGAITDEARGVDTVFVGWLAGELDPTCPGGESGVQMRDRVSAALEQIAGAHPGQTVAVVSHGGALALGVTSLCASGTPEVMPNCGRAVIERDADGWHLVSWPARRLSR